MDVIGCRGCLLEGRSDDQRRDDWLAQLCLRWTALELVIAEKNSTAADDIPSFDFERLLHLWRLDSIIYGKVTG